VREKPYHRVTETAEFARKSKNEIIFSTLILCDLCASAVSFWIFQCLLGSKLVGSLAI